MIAGKDGENRLLEKLVLGKGTNSEDWLQKQIHRFPALLPVHHIEPGFGDLISVAREIPCSVGAIDNLYLTPSADIVLVETKLWANPEARRKVVMQTLDYVAAVMRMSYEQFEAAVLKGQRDPGSPGSLYAMVGDRPDALGEAAFRDALSRNLKRGRILALIVGDGIREEAEALASLVQGHAGAHFTLALVALSAWRDTVSGATLIVPDVLAQTVMIERGIVRFVDGDIQVSESKAVSAQPQNITDQDYFTELAKTDPALPLKLQDFVERLKPYGIYADIKKSLIIRADLPSRVKPISFGYIDKTGKYWSHDLETTTDRATAATYADDVAALIGGRVADIGSHLTIDGKAAPTVKMLLAHADAWEEILQKTIASLEANARGTD